MKIRDRIKELRRVKASELLPNPKNWRTHPVAQQDALKGILAEVGFAGAVLVRELDDGSLMLIDGHMRAETTHDQEIPVLILDVDEAESDKLLATFDPIAAMAESDAHALDALLRNVDTGSEALSKMLAQLAEGAGLYLDEKEVIEDEVPEPPVEPITKAGDLWLLGDHRVLCGDSTKAEDVTRLMVGVKADAILTDPPYGVSYADKNTFLNAIDKGASNQTKIENDHLGEEDTTNMLRDSFKSAYEICAVGGAWYITAPPGPGFHEFAAILKKLKVWRQTLIWVKSSFVLGRSDYKYQHEPIFYGWKPGAPHQWLGNMGEASVYEDVKQESLTKLKKDELLIYAKALIARISQEQTSILREAKPNLSIEHPTMKPVKLFARLISNSVKANQTIYDPFLGSGTTLIAAEQLGRKCYGMEISPAYCDVIVQRWEKLTGKTATLEVKNG